MLGRKKFGYRECLCRNCYPSGHGNGRRYLKTRVSNRLSRKVAKLQIQGQYDDYLDE